MQGQVQPEHNAGGKAEVIRLPDLEIWAGPRELEFEPELPKGSKFDPQDSPRMEVVSGTPEIISFGPARFEPSSIRLMIPLTAVREGEATVNYRIHIPWVDKAGQRCLDERVLVQKMYVLERGGATVPWVHYKATPTP